MIEILNFVFSSFWVFIGTLILISVLSNCFPIIVFNCPTFKKHRAESSNE